MISRSHARFGIAAACVLAAYVVTAKAGIALPVAHGVISPVWAPTGIALAAVFWGGRPMMPMVFLGAFIANATSGADLLPALGIALGNTAEAAAGAWILRQAGFLPTLERARDVAAIAIAAPLCATIGAVNGVFVLDVADAVANDQVPTDVLLWWLGDVMGALIVAPAIFAVGARLRSAQFPSALRLAEFAALLTTTLLVSTIVFEGDRWRFPGLLFPMWIWAAIRFRAIGVTLTTLIVGAIAIHATLTGTVVVPGASDTQTVQALQSVLALVGISALLIAATLAERDASRRQFEEAYQLELAVTTQLRELDEVKNNFLTAVSHELRTPLTSILGLSATLRDRRRELNDATIEKMCEHLAFEAARLDRLLADLLDLDRLRMGIVEPSFESVDVNELVATVSDRFRRRGRTVEEHLDACVITADPIKLERIVDNLLGNANKHTPSTGRIYVATSVEDDGVLIVVGDEGGGVPDGMKESVYEPFNRGNAAMSHAPGTGVGLSLVAQFVALHGGRTWVTDRAGGGAEFHVYLPREHDTP